MGQRSHEHRAGPVECSNCNVPIRPGAIVYLHDGEEVCAACRELLNRARPELTDVRAGETVGIVRPPPPPPRKGELAILKSALEGLARSDRISIADGIRIGLGILIAWALVALAAGVLGVFLWIIRNIAG